MIAWLIVAEYNLIDFTGLTGIELYISGTTLIGLG